ncbi:hypothetical protein RHGRI_037933 [Rhododendron griersonianum]|uniref:dihydropyrimidinase n=1 Tax=Rhododendron griersonianum TaxID=479676 RepID=A0AAV6HZ72_9ERIC|nr:hypothetical protein RHGRI_037933 [Rhododendron griersonianum]
MIMAANPRFQMTLFPYFLTLLLSIFSSVSESSQFCEAGIGYTQCGASPYSSSKILIKGGTVVNAHHQEIADVYVEDGIIAAVKPNIKVGDEVTVLDATGKFVMPGGIDPHTHLALKSMATETVDDFFSGQAAALAGGTTMHIDFVFPVQGSLSSGFEAYVEKAKKSCINSFKFFLAYKGAVMVNDELLLEGLKKCKSLGALAMVHAENGDAVFEGQKRMIELGITGPEGHALSRPPVTWSRTVSLTHLYSSKPKKNDLRQFETLKNTPLRGYPVDFESLQGSSKADARCTVSESGRQKSKGFKDGRRRLYGVKRFVMSPPIRTSGHGKALQGGLSTGILQLVGTDHCAFNSTQKAFGIDDFRKIPNGVNGIEERMHLVWDTMVESGQISVTDYVRITSTECARIFNIYPRKGAILVGSDADIIILNPNSSFGISATSHHSRSDTNVYDGRRGKGKVEVTISRGRVVWENGQLNVAPGSGKYIEMPPFGYLFDGIDKVDSNYLSSLRAPVKRSKATS